MKISHRITIAAAFFTSIAAFVYFSSSPAVPLQASEDIDAPLGPLRGVLSAFHTQGHAVEWVGVVVEIPRGSGTKYKYDEHSNNVQFEKALPPNVQFPGEYGIIPGTRSGDGELLEVIVVGQLPTYPGVHIQVRPIGLIRIRNEDGVHDDKVIGLPALDQSFNPITDITNLPPEMREEVAGFFRTFTMFDGKQTAVIGWGNVVDAQKTIIHARTEYGKLKSWER